MNFKYLRRVNDTCLILDHRLTPEVRSMLCAMASRMPAGGIEARYAEVVEAVRSSLVSQLHDHSQHGAAHGLTTQDAEDELTDYPLHPVVKEFFDKFVKNYGHSSVMELTGSPSVYVEGVSPFTAYLSFDNPLVAGQEFSTRAVRRKDWPMCREAMIVDTTRYEDVEISHSVEFPEGSIVVEQEISFETRGPQPPKQQLDVELSVIKPHPDLAELHREWLEVFEAEVAAWQEELRLPCGACDGGGGTYTKDDTVEECRVCHGTGKKYPFIKDPQAFRPALDRARWAIPSTIATGFSHTMNVRTMGRVIKTGEAFSAKKCPHCSRPAREEDTLTCATCGGKCREPSKVWADIKEAYEQALPGMAGMWSREAVATTDRLLPAHLNIGSIAPGWETFVRVIPVPYSNPKATAENWGAYKRKANGYLDPVWNQLCQVFIEFQCSWAVARDWHRHRTAHPWNLRLVRNTSTTMDPATGEYGEPQQGPFHIHQRYKSLTDVDVFKMMAKSAQLYDRFVAAGDMEKAMLCIPLGAKVSMRTTMGLRDAVYMLELRANAHGANFEYEAQAKDALRQLKEILARHDLVETIFPEEL